MEENKNLDNFWLECGRQFGKTDVSTKWLLKPNKDFAKLDGKALSPIDLIIMGRGEAVINHLRNGLLGHPS